MARFPLSCLRCFTIRLGTALVLAVFIAGCVYLSDSMKSWVGGHRDKLIQSWGPPNQEQTLSDGSRSMVYITYWGDQYGSYTCRKVFNTDFSGVIRSWSYSGCQS